MSTKAKQKGKKGSATTPPHQGPWAVEFFERHPSNDSARSAPGYEYLETCPISVKEEMLETLKAVAKAPPPSFSGGGRWEAMKKEMKGYYEVRDRHRGQLYRLFCLLERNGKDAGLTGSSVIVLCGMTKANGTAFTKEDYAWVKQLGEEYMKRTPRSVKR